MLEPGRPSSAALSRLRRPSRSFLMRPTEEVPLTSMAVAATNQPSVDCGDFDAVRTGDGGESLARATPPPGKTVRLSNCTVVWETGTRRERARGRSLFVKLHCSRGCRGGVFSRHIRASSASLSSRRLRASSSSSSSALGKGRRQRPSTAYYWGRGPRSVSPSNVSHSSRSSGSRRIQSSGVDLVEASSLSRSLRAQASATSRITSSPVASAQGLLG